MRITHVVGISKLCLWQRISTLVVLLLYVDFTVCNEDFHTGLVTIFLLLLCIFSHRPSVIYIILINSFTVEFTLALI